MFTLFILHDKFEKRMSLLSSITLTIFNSFIFLFAFQLCYSQNSVTPEFKNESSIVQKMLTDSSVYFSNDSLTIHLGYYPNGLLKGKIVYYHPEGPPEEKWLFEYLNFAQTGYHENGRAAYYNEWWNNKLNGSYLQFDSDLFVTHWIFEDNILVDVKNDNCRYLDPKGIVISKEEFFNQYKNQEFGDWIYYLFERDFEPYKDLKCCDFVLHSEKFDIPAFPGKGADKLIEELNKSCK
jgi:hypothetical protein